MRLLKSLPPLSPAAATAGSCSTCAAAVAPLSRANCCPTGAIASAAMTSITTTPYIISAAAADGAAVITVFGRVDAVQTYSAVFRGRDETILL